MSFKLEPALTVKLSGEIFTKSPSTQKVLLRNLMSDLELKLKRYDIRAELSYKHNRLIVRPLPRKVPDLLKVLMTQPGVNSVVPSLFIRATTWDELLRTLLRHLKELIRLVKPHSLKLFWEKVPQVIKQDAIALKEEVLSEVRFTSVPIAVGSDPRDLDIRLEARGDEPETLILIRSHELKGPGGLPPIPDEAEVGVLLSEGPDSLISAWRLARRGVKLVVVHITMEEEVSPLALESMALLRLVQPRCRLIIGYRWGAVLSRLSSKGPKRELCLRCKANMVSVAADILRELTGRDRVAVATGEIVGEQASQTLNAMLSTWPRDYKLILLKPLAGHAKEEVYQDLKRAGFYESVISRPHKRCPFVPEVPKTKSDRLQPTLSLKELKEMGFRYEPLDKGLPNPLALVTLPSKTLEIIALLEALSMVSSSGASSQEESGPNGRRDFLSYAVEAPR